MLSHVWLFAISYIVAHQAPLSMEFPRQEYWSGVPFTSPWNLPDPEIETRPPVLQVDSLSSEPQVKPLNLKAEIIQETEVVYVDLANS